MRTREGLSCIEIILLTDSWFSLYSLVLLCYKFDSCFAI
jgi:hypothetical protein